MNKCLHFNVSFLQSDEFYHFRQKIQKEQQNFHALYLIFVDKDVNIQFENYRLYNVQFVETGSRN